MNPCFADAFYFLALLNEDDACHRSVLEFSRSIRRPIVTTAWVLTEVADAMAQPVNRPLFLRLVQDLRNDPGSTVVPCTPDLYESGLSMYAERPDKGWSLTDCISFVVMRERRVSEALTRDHHFEQAGFFVLLKDS